MQIYIDADACPAPVKEILFRAADRTGVALVLVANQALRVPRSAHIRAVTVGAGLDAADEHIAQSVQPGDVVVTADIPLAAQVVASGAHALNPRGELYTEENIRERLAMRDLMTELRATGSLSGGPAAYGKRERQAFANQLDRLLTRARGRTSASG